MEEEKEFRERVIDSKNFEKMLELIRSFPIKSSIVKPECSAYYSTQENPVKYNSSPNFWN